MNIKVQRELSDKYNNNIYDFISNFEDDVAVVELNNKYGLIDKTGKELTAPIYDKIYSFNYDVAVVELNNKCGLIDKTGKELTAPIYDKIHSFHYDVAVVELNNKFGLINKKGKELIKPKYDKVYDFVCDITDYKIDGKYGLIDKYGKVLTDPIYDSEVIIYEGKSDVLIVTQNNKKRLITRNLVPVTPYYDDIGFINENVLLIINNGKKVLIDKEGKEKIKIKCDIFYAEGHGFATAKLYKKRALINKEGKIITKFKNQDFSVLSDDLISIDIRDTKGNIKYGLIDKDGKEILKPKYDGIYYCDNGAIIVKKNNKYGLFKDGKIDFKYIDITYLKNWLLYVINDNGRKRYGLLDIYGNEITPPIYSGISNFNDDLLVARKLNGGYILIYKDGKEFINKEYSFVLFDNFYKCNDENFIKFEKSGRRGLLDKNGNIFIDSIYDYITTYDDFISVTKDGKEGILDKQGNIIIPAEYTTINVLTDGLFVVRKYNKYGIVDSKGKVILEPIYRKIEYLGNGFIKVRNENKLKGIFDVNGNEIIPANNDDVSLIEETDGIFECYNDDKIKLLNKENKIILKEDSYSYIEGLNKKIICVGLNDKKGLVDIEGNILTDFIYDDIRLQDNLLIFNDKYVVSLDNFVYMVNIICNGKEYKNDFNNINQREKHINDLNNKFDKFLERLYMQSQSIAGYNDEYLYSDIDNCEISKDKTKRMN